MEKILSEKIKEEKRFLYEDYISYKNLKGVSNEKLNNLEKDLEVALPEDFKAFYRYKNGSNYSPLFFTAHQKSDNKNLFYMFSIEKIRSFWIRDTCFMEEIYTKEEIARLDKRIKPFLNNKKWIPFSHSITGSHLLYLDFDPTKEGKRGQIIHFIHDPDFVYYVAENFTEMLRESNKYFDKIENIEDYIV